MRLYESGAGGKELVEEAVAAFRKVSAIDSSYKPQNLAEAERLLAELGGLSAAAPPASSSTLPSPCR